MVNNIWCMAIGFTIKNWTPGMVLDAMQVPQDFILTKTLTSGAASAKMIILATC